MADTPQAPIPQEPPTQGLVGTLPPLPTPATPGGTTGLIGKLPPLQLGSYQAQQPSSSSSSSSLGLQGTLPPLQSEKPAAASEPSAPSAEPSSLSSSDTSVATTQGLVGTIPPLQDYTPPKEGFWQRFFESQVTPEQQAVLSAEASVHTGDINKDIPATLEATGGPAAARTAGSAAMKTIGQGFQGAAGLYQSLQNFIKAQYNRQLLMDGFDKQLMDKVGAVPDTTPVEKTALYGTGTQIIENWEQSSQQLLADKKQLGAAYGTIQTLGSFVPILVSGLGGGESALMRVGTLSALAGGGQQLEDAVAHKATPEQKKVAVWAGTALGATAIIPMDVALSRINQVEGGAILTKFLSKFLDEKSIIGKTAKVAVLPTTMALQQAAYTVASNLTARDFAGYDPTKDPTEGLQDAFTNGAGAGTVMTLLIHSLVGFGGLSSLAKTPDLAAQQIAETDRLAQFNAEERHIGTLYPQMRWARLLEKSPVTKLPFEAPPIQFFAEMSEKLMDKFPETGLYNVSDIKQRAAQVGGPEQKLVLSVLKKFEGMKKVDAGQFKAALQDRLLAFRTETFTGDSTVSHRLEDGTDSPELWGDVGKHIFNGEVPVENYVVHIVKAPYHTTLGGVLRSDHYPQFPDYYAHVRGMYHNGVFHTLELQSDFADGSRERATNESVVRQQAETGIMREAPQETTQQRLNEPIVTAPEVRKAGALVKGIDSASDTILHDLMYQKQAARQAMIRHAQRGEEVIRFPTPETVARVEGWVKGSLRLTDEQIRSKIKGRNLDAYNKALQQVKEFKASIGKPIFYNELVFKASEMGRTDLLDALAIVSKGKPRDFTKLFASYEKLSKWFEANGARLVTDEFGNTWHEADLTPEMANASQVNFDSTGLGLIMQPHLDAIAEHIDITPPEEPPLSPPTQRTPPERPIREDLDNFSRGMQVLDAITMIVDKNKNVPVLGPLLLHYQDTLAKWWQTSLQWKYRGDETIKELFKTVGFKQRPGLYKFITDLGLISHRERKRFEVGSAKFKELVQKHKLNRAQINWYHRLDGDYRAVVAALKEASVSEARRLYLPTDELSFKKAVAKIEELYNPLYNRNFIPFTRFGSRVVVVKATDAFVDADGVTHTAGSVIDMPFVEGVRQEHKVNKLVQELTLKYRNKPVMITPAKLEDNKTNWEALPVEMAATIQKELGLSPEQQNALADLLIQMSPSQSFARHLMRRAGIPGFSTDVGRAYAEYMGRFGNHIARLTHGGKLLDAIKAVSDSAHQMTLEGKDNKKRVEIASHLNDHYTYIMNRKSEWAGARSMVFLWYLSFLPKSALMNSMQVPMFTYPYLAAKYGRPITGDIRALRQIGKAYKNLTQNVFMNLLEKATKNSSTMFNNPKVIEPHLAENLAKAVKDGTLDQAIATEMAAAARGSIMERSMPGSVFGRTLRQTAALGAWPFAAVEKLNRYVTFIAAHRMAQAAMEKSLGRKYEDWDPAERNQLYQEAKDAVQKTQFEYAFWNRPQYAWGIRSAAFVFTMYTRNSLYYYRHLPGRGRALFVLAALGGLSALPFAQDIENFIDALFNSNSGRKMFNIPPGKYINSNIMIHEYLNNVLGKTNIAADLGMKTPEMTELLMHGALHKYGLGPLGALGLPVDMSSSVSLGKVIPFSELPAQMETHQITSPSGAISAVLKDAGGVLGNLAYNFMQAAMSDNPDTLKRVQEAVPRFMGNLIKAAEAAYKGQWTTGSGFNLGNIDTQNPADVAELLAQGIGGFTPTAVSEAQEVNFATQISARFFEGQRRMLLMNYAQAYMSGNPTKVRDAEAEIVKFNNSAPSGVAIVSKSMIESVKQRLINQELKKEGQPPKNQEAVSQSVQQAFGQQPQ